MKNSPIFSILFLLQLHIWSSSSTLPVDFVFYSSCTTNLDCPHYRTSRCSAVGQCDRCTTTADCLHISQDPGVECASIDGTAATKYCKIPCSSTNKELCVKMRSWCSSGRCAQCGSDTQFINQGYPGDSPAFCHLNALPSYPACSSCPKTGGCPRKSECKNFKCTECSSDDDCEGSTPFCERKFEGDFCRGCYEDNHCTAAKSKCSGYNCIKCADDNDCTHITGKPKCHATKGCVECLGNGDCASGHCVGNACLECVQHTDCLDNAKPYCLENICKNAIYQPQCSPDYKIQVHQINDKRHQFDIAFPSELASKIDIKATLTLTLQNTPHSDYTYTLNKVTTTYYQVILAIRTSIPSTKLRLQLPCPTQPGYLFGDIILDTPIKNIPYTTPEIQETVETIKDVTSITNSVMAGASGSMMLAGANPAIMWALIELLQAFYYMIFINVQYPVNVQAFFGLFTLGNLSFIPNPIEWFFPEIEGVDDLQAPEKFLENDLDGLFLQTAGNMLLTWFLVLLGYLISKFILRFLRNMPKLLNTAASKTVEIFEWSGVIRTLLTSYTQLSLAAFLQIRVLNFDRRLYGVSSLSGIAFTIFAFVFPPVTIFLIQKLSKSPKLLKAKYSTLTEEFKYDKQKLTPIYFNAFFVIRRLALTLTLVFLHDYPYLELLTLILNCIVWLGLLCWFSPYDKKINNVVNIISEFLFVVIHVIIFLFVHDDKDWLTDKKKLDLGWVIIGCCGVILGLTLIVSFIEQYYMVKNLIKLLLKAIKGKKISSLKVQRKSSPQVYPKNSENPTRTVSTVQLENSMTFMPLVRPQNNSYKLRRIMKRPQVRARQRGIQQITENLEIL